jgi:hypothetical protein
MMVRGRPKIAARRRPATARRHAVRLATRLAKGATGALLVLLAALPPAPAGAATSPPATTVAWFCEGPGSTPCPAQVEYQIVSGGVLEDNGIPIGRYVDNEDPTQLADVNADLTQGVGIVLAGVSQGDAGTTVAGALSSLEWYPFPAYGLAAAPPPGYGSYILQAGFSWPGQPPPSAAEIQQSYCGTLALHPRMIVFYFWTPAAWAAVQSADCSAGGTAAVSAGGTAALPRGRGESARPAAARHHRRHRGAQRRRQQQRKHPPQAA